MKALVTGGTGFIGSHLVEELLSRNWDVRVLAKDKMYGEELDAPVTIADCSDSDAMAELLPGVDVVFHLAGVTRARHSKDYYIGNHEATRCLLKACADHGNSLQRFLFADLRQVPAATVTLHGVVDDFRAEPTQQFVEL